MYTTHFAAVAVPGWSDEGSKPEKWYICTYTLNFHDEIWNRARRTLNKTKCKTQYFHF